MMITHGDGWRAIDLLAENNRLSVSDLARVAGQHVAGIPEGLHRRSTAWAKSRGGEVLAKQLTKAKARQVCLASENKVHEDIVLPSNGAVWISRIVLG